MKIGSPEWSKLIIDGARVFDLDLESRHTDLFAVHARELLHWTRITNLTTITDPYEIAIKHYVDSLAPAGMMSSDATLLDIGSGGGFPGIPLKVVIPSLEVTLVDASRKKVNFLKHVIRILKLDGIEALHTRVEELAKDPAHAKHFDFIASRALTDLKSFVSQARPLLAADGLMIALKGKMDETAVEAARSHILAVETYRLPFADSERSIFKIR
jgi:16S rRNA (guanine527-N7)-methyltransferase